MPDLPTGASQLPSHQSSAELHLSLQGQVILITGATTQPGRAVSYACHLAGADTILLDKDPAALNDFYDSLSEETQRDPAIFPFDLRELDRANSADVRKLLEKEFVKIDAVIHCAQWGAPLTPLEHVEIDHWWQVLESQLIAPWLLTKSLLPLLNKSLSAKVIFTSHEVGNAGKAYWGPFGAAFSAINNLVETWNDEMEQQNINFFSVDPGKIRSEWRTKLFPAEHPDTLTPANDPSVVDRYLKLLV
jgi:NAD(P)-dependent dehydrogenase (short-subunit alcohol dehydrogenase family)